jgi:hypothetical protein
MWSWSPVRISVGILLRFFAIGAGLRVDQPQRQEAFG